MTLRTAILALSAICLTAGIALAQVERWLEFDSETHLYKARLPDPMNVKSSYLPVGPGKAAYSEEVSGSANDTGEPEDTRFYVAKFDQTIGQPVSKDEAERLIKDELDLYVSHYKKMGGVVKRREKISHLEDHRVRDKELMEKPGAELYINYQDPELGPRVLRLNIFFTDYSRFEQVYIGPEKEAFRYLTGSFFSTRSLLNGLAKIPDPEKARWQEIKSPAGIFTARAPQKAAPFFTEDPVIKPGDRAEFMGLVFYDPIRGEKIFFNIYGYKFDAPLDFRNAQTVLLAKHLSKHRGPGASGNSGYTGVRFEREIAEGIPAISMRYTMRPMEGYPYATYVRSRAMFLGNLMVFAEVLGSELGATSELATNLLKNLEFHAPAGVKPPELMEE